MALISYLSRVHFDFGAIATIGDVLDALEIRRPLLATDPGVVAAGLPDRLVAALGGEPAAMFGETPSNPTEAAAKQALERFHEAGCDGIVALGGGSAIDLAKAVGLLATHSGTLVDYGILAGGTDRIGEIAPVVAVPTTAGTGSEVGRAASLTLENGSKAACVSPRLIPRVAICDPELTISLPADMTAATGMDALSHGIETFLSNRVNPPAEAIALDCVGRAGQWIERAAADGTNREARWQMLMAALEGGLTFQKGLGAVHAVSHPLGALGLHHGTLNAVLLPAVLRFNESHCGDKYARLRLALGLSLKADLADWVQDLNARLGLPAGLGALGVDPAVLPEIAAAAARDHLSETNPRPATSKDYRAILDDAMGPI